MSEPENNQYYLVLSVFPWTALSGNFGQISVNVQSSEGIGAGFCVVFATEDEARAFASTINAPVVRMERIEKVPVA